MLQHVDSHARPPHYPATYRDVRIVVFREQGASASTSQCSQSATFSRVVQEESVVVVVESDGSEVESDGMEVDRELRLLLDE